MCFVRACACVAHHNLLDVLFYLPLFLFQPFNHTKVKIEFIKSSFENRFQFNSIQYWELRFVLWFRFLSPAPPAHSFYKFVSMDFWLVWYNFVACVCLPIKPNCLNWYFSTVGGEHFGACSITNLIHMYWRKPFASFSFGVFCSTITCSRGRQLSTHLCHKVLLNKTKQQKRY